MPPGHSSDGRGSGAHEPESRSVPEVVEVREIPEWRGEREHAKRSDVPQTGDALAAGGTHEPEPVAKSVGACPETIVVQHLAAGTGDEGPISLRAGAVLADELQTRDALTEQQLVKNQTGVQCPVQQQG